MLPHESLLDVRICDLDVTIEGTWLERQIEQLYNELARRGLRFRPRCWLSGEWFTPDHVPGIAIPFYLAHTRLRKLEDRMMFEVEGGTRAWCMQLLRHETGHAYETAYQLGRRPRWRKIFGRPTKPYPHSYRPRPVSKRYVLHLDWWYAQSHPCEDFAETFAVWLGATTRWRRRYDGWPALKKILYVDELMTELAGRAPRVRSRAKVESANRIRMTLREYYKPKQSRSESDHPDFFDRDLTRL
ncbi:MAG: putative zinc-binding metallopeptidase, partial [Candidatus Krumholzibacteria bacterium]|nr:putative zinc-binding metallopeptidase [Candidatus Krumholzibacteria bacterium]